VALYVVPTHLDLRDARGGAKGDRLEVALGVLARASGFSLDPGRVVLTIDGRELRPVATSLENPQRMRRAFDAFAEGRKSTGAASPATLDPSQWRDAVEGTQPITTIGEYYRFDLRSRSMRPSRHPAR